MRLDLRTTLNVALALCGAAVVLEFGPSQAAQSANRESLGAAPQVNAIVPTAAALAAPTIIYAPPASAGNGLQSYSNKMTLVGTGSPGATINVYDGLSLLGAGKVRRTGVWYFATLTPVADGTHAFTATQSNSAGQASAASLPETIAILPAISNFSTLTDNWSNPLLVDRSQFYLENANVSGNAPWAIALADTHTLRFVLKPGDLWPDNDSHRTEISGATLYTPSQTVVSSYQFMVEPGPTNQFWTVMGQFHSDDGSSISQHMNPNYPVFAVELTGKGGHGQGDYLAIWADYALPGQTTPTSINGSGLSGWLYVSPAPIVRGAYYTMRIEAHFANNSSGFLEVWINSAQVIDYHGPIGYGASNYWKEGIYQDEANTAQTIAADFRNLWVSGWATPPLIEQQSLSGALLSLSGVGKANCSVTIFDGANAIGSAAVASSGAWSFMGSAPLAAGTHIFTARLTDTDGAVSTPSNAVALVVPAAVAVAAPLN